MLLLLRPPMENICHWMEENAHSLSLREWDGSGRAYRPWGNGRFLPSNGKYFPWGASTARAPLFLICQSIPIYNNTNLFSRDKRVKLSGADFEDADEQSPRRVRAGKSQNFPIVLPYYALGEPVTQNPKWGSCLLYLEGISVIVFGKNQRSHLAKIDGANGKNKFNFDDDSVSCPSPKNNDKTDKKDKKLQYVLE